MTIELKPCPFCGNRKSVTLEKKNSGYQVRCQHCGGRGKYVVVRTFKHKAKAEAVEEWNRRAGVNHVD